MHMITAQVIADAYASQLADPSCSGSGSGSGSSSSIDLQRLGKRGSGSVDMNRIKAGILEEFEKSRDGYEQ